MGKVLLTGVTGCLGIELLREILEKTDHSVVVIVRAYSYQGGLKRLLNCSERVGLNRPDLLERTTIAVGDLTEPFFGLKQSTYQDFSREITHIVHSAASISLEQGDDDAIFSIICPLQQVMDFAAQCTQLQRIDYVSTVGVGGRDFKSLPESLDINTRNYHNSYEKYKHEAEHLFLNSIPEGVRFTVHRPSMIIGRSDSGRINSFHIFYSICKLLTGQLTGGIIPDMDWKAFDTIPVDWVASGIAACINHHDNAPSVLHHCVGPEHSVSLQQLSELIEKSWKSDQNNSAATHVPVNSFKASYPLMIPFMPDAQRKEQKFIPHFLEYVDTEQEFENSTSRCFLKEQAGLEFESPLPGIRRSLLFYQRQSGGLKS